MVSRIKDRKKSWKGRWLSYAGRTTMLKSILSTIIIHQVSYMNLPMEKEELNKNLRTFFYQGTRQKKKISILASYKVCWSKEEIGVGIKSIREQSIDLRENLI